MSSGTSPPLTSTRRPVPLQFRGDLIFEQAVYQGEPCWIVKDPLSLHYARLSPEQYRILHLLDGRRSLDDLRDALQREFPTLRPGHAEIQSLVLDLHRKNLLLSRRFGQAVELHRQERARRRAAFWSAAQSILYIRLPGWDPERTLRRIYPLVRGMFHSAAVVAGVLLVVASWLLLAVHFDRFQQRLPDLQDFFVWPGALGLWLTVGAAKVIHELAHGLACRHFGGECHEIGVAFLVFSPCLYCDVSDSWMLPDKWKRILISSAGMFIELVLSALAVFGWWFTQPGTLNSLCLNVFLVTTLTTILFNANPLLRLDGYYILSDLLEIPNLRSRSEQCLFQTFCRTCLGIHVPGGGGDSGSARFWLITYAVAAAAYRWFLALAIIGVLYGLLKPYGLGWVGLSLGIGSFALIPLRIMRRIVRQLAAGSESMNRLRSGLAAATAFMLVAVLLKVPLPLHAVSPLLVEPAQLQRAYVTTPGQLEEVYARPGQRVRRGDPLVRLSNVEIEDRCRRLQTAEAVQLVEVSVQRALGDSAQEEIALGALKTIQEQLAECRKQRAELVVVAPCEGIVVAAAGRPAPMGDETSSGALAGWSGTPLDAENVGCHLERGTHLLSIARGAEYQAVLLVDQDHRNELAAGQDVQIQLEHRPWHTHTGRIAAIARQHLEFAPTALSARYGGALPTRTDPQGRERLESSVWRVTASLDDADPDLLRPGLRGHARFATSRRSAGDWLLRELRTLFHFRF